MQKQNIIKNIQMIGKRNLSIIFFLLGVCMDKRILNVFVIILCVIFFIFPIFVRYNIAYAYTLPSNNSYGYSADEARAIVNNHETIYTKDGKPIFTFQ